MHAPVIEEWLEPTTNGQDGLPQMRRWFKLETFCHSRSASPQNEDKIAQICDDETPCFIKMVPADSLTQNEDKIRAIHDETPGFIASLPIPSCKTYPDVYAQRWYDSGDEIRGAIHSDVYARCDVGQIGDFLPFPVGKLQKRTKSTQINDETPCFTQ